MIPTPSGPYPCSQPSALARSVARAHAGSCLLANAIAESSPISSSIPVADTNTDLAANPGPDIHADAASFDTASFDAAIASTHADTGLLANAVAVFGPILLADASTDLTADAGSIALTDRDADLAANLGSVALTDTNANLAANPSPIAVAYSRSQPDPDARANAAADRTDRSVLSAAV